MISLLKHTAISFGIIYAVIGSIVCIIGLVDMMDDDNDPGEFKIRSAIPTFAFYFFIAPGYLCFIVTKDIIKQTRRKRGR